MSPPTGSSSVKFNDSLDDGRKQDVPQLQKISTSIRGGEEQSNSSETRPEMDRSGNKKPPKPQKPPLPTDPTQSVPARSSPKTIPAPEISIAPSNQDPPISIPLRPASTITPTTSSAAPTIPPTARPPKPSLPADLPYRSSPPFIPPRVVVTQTAAQSTSSVYLARCASEGEGNLADDEGSMGDLPDVDADDDRHDMGGNDPLHDLRDRDFVMSIHPPFGLLRNTQPKQIKKRAPNKVLESQLFGHPSSIEPIPKTVGSLSDFEHEVFLATGPQDDTSGTFENRVAHMGSLASIESAGVTVDARGRRRMRLRRGVDSEEWLRMAKEEGDKECSSRSGSDESIDDSLIRDVVKSDPLPIADEMARLTNGGTEQPAILDSAVIDPMPAQPCIRSDGAASGKGTAGRESAASSKVNLPATLPQTTDQNMVVVQSGDMVARESKAEQNGLVTEPAGVRGSDSRVESVPGTTSASPELARTNVHPSASIKPPDQVSLSPTNPTTHPPSQPSLRHRTLSAGSTHPVPLRPRTSSAGSPQNAVQIKTLTATPPTVPPDILHSSAEASHSRTPSHSSQSHHHRSLSRKSGSLVPKVPSRDSLLETMKSQLSELQDAAVISEAELVTTQASYATSLVKFQSAYEPLTGQLHNVQRFMQRIDAHMSANKDTMEAVEMARRDSIGETESRRSLDSAMQEVRAALARRKAERELGGLSIAASTTPLVGSALSGHLPVHKRSLEDKLAAAVATMNEQVRWREDKARNCAQLATVTAAACQVAEQTVQAWPSLRQLAKELQMAVDERVKAKQDFEAMQRERRSLRTRAAAQASTSYQPVRSSTAAQ
ncbi:hypothetical protein DFS34DRAFT_594283 [Phlyctochytrium arcticum]|nr:hypothetical protein DFS34DRAFT_594283 [Phlyctochytrium arcticum]